MAEYQLTATDAVIRTEDGASIPPDMANRDYNGDTFSPGYVQWKEAGGVPDPYVPPPPIVPQATEEMALMYDHENRLLALEGKPPMELRTFINNMKGG